MAIVLDLDKLVPENKQLVFNGNAITVKPLTTAQLLKLGVVGNRLQNTDDKSATDLNDLATQLQDLLAEIVPELKGQELNSAQLMALLNFIVEGAVSDKGGVEVQTDLKAH